MPCQVLSFVVLVVPDLLFDAESMVTRPHDVFVRFEACKDGNSVDLQLFKAHEEVVDVTVLALHDDLADHSWKLLLLCREQRGH